MFDLYISFHILLARSCTCYQLDIFLFEIKYIFILKDLDLMINHMIFELTSTKAIFLKSFNSVTLQHFLNKVNYPHILKNVSDKWKNYFCLLALRHPPCSLEVHRVFEKKKWNENRKRNRQVQHFKYFATRYSEYK